MYSGPHDVACASGLPVPPISPLPRIGLARPLKDTKSVVETPDIAELVTGEFLNGSLRKVSLSASAS